MGSLVPLSVLLVAIIIVSAPLFVSPVLIILLSGQDVSLSPDDPIIGLDISNVGPSLGIWCVFLAVLWSLLWPYYVTL